MLKIYGADLSGPSNRVRFAANALGLEYEYVYVKLREGEHKTPEFLKINPIGKVPAIDDDGFFLFESGAICRYLCRKADNPSIYPDDTKKKAVIDQWTDFAVHHVYGSVARLFYNRVIVPVIGEKVDERSVEDGIKFLGRYLPVVDQQLEKNKFIAGDELSLADITLISALDPVDVVQHDISGYPHIVKYRNELRKKDWYQKCFKVYGEPLKAMQKG